MALIDLNDYPNKPELNEFNRKTDILLEAMENALIIHGVNNSYRKERVHTPENVLQVSRYLYHYKATKLEIVVQWNIRFTLTRLVIGYKFSFYDNGLAHTLIAQFRAYYDEDRLDFFVEEDCEFKDYRQGINACLDELLKHSEKISHV